LVTKGALVIDRAMTLRDEIKPLGAALRAQPRQCGDHADDAVGRCPQDAGQSQVRVIPRPQCDRARVDEPHSWHLWHGELSSSGLGTGSRAAASTKILIQLVKFQVYAQAENSSITIVCCGAVSDCGNLIKTTRLAVPSPARWFAVRLSMLLICRMAFITKKNQPGSFPLPTTITARKRRWPRHARQQPECSHVCVPGTVPNGTTGRA